MARPTRAAAALAGKQANKQSTSPYFDKTKPTSKGKNSVKSKGKQPARRAKVLKKDQYPSSDDFESEESDTSSEDSGDAEDVYKEPDSDAIDDDDAGSDFEEEDEDEEVDAASVISEDIDDEDVLDFSVKKKGNGASSANGSGKKKRKGSKDGGRASSNGGSPSKKAKKSSKDSDFEDDAGDEDEDASEEELQDGRKVVRTKLVKAPSHHVKPGLVDPHTMEFLSELRTHNDREWFAKNDARYRHALLNWQAFVTEIQTEFQRGDWSIPEMPAKDLIHRIYRDVRFSNDKTPYKTNFAASFSRAGRKGSFAGYYLQISPGGRSLLAGGKWTPDKNDLATIRTNIIRNSKPFRRIINAPRFVELFGPAKPDAKGKGTRCNVFGADDMLKVAPKMNGVDKNHKDIDLLKLRTIGVVHYFKDEDVIKPTFRQQVQDVVEAMSPLVLHLNDLLHPQSDAEEEEEEEEDEEEDQASVPDDEEQDRIEVTAASRKLCESAVNDEEPVEEDDSDGQEGEGGIEEA
ncbi:hypothetical protein P389DRAFT_193832 [Cystobasidium minutum MCA 4210]|uniref:uncharacterized protein n=1 Tax=Cystobasidium minutum MCA 4210 TaxID=1397322 RepID=UPI0034CF3951|eukprot:jgi/Rhomi1/193832/gm1.2046_g